MNNLINALKRVVSTQDVSAPEIETPLPRMKRRIGLSNIGRGWFSFHASREDADLFRPYGELHEHSSGSSGYTLYIDSRYDMGDILDYIRVLESENRGGVR